MFSVFYENNLEFVFFYINISLMWANIVDFARKIWWRTENLLYFLKLACLAISLMIGSPLNSHLLWSASESSAQDLSIRLSFANLYYNEERNYFYSSKNILICFSSLSSAFLSSLSASFKFWVFDSEKILSEFLNNTVWTIHYWKKRIWRVEKTFVFCIGIIDTQSQFLYYSPVS